MDEFSRNAETTAGGGELAGVGGEVGNHLTQTSLVADYDSFGVFRLHETKRDAGRLETARFVQSMPGNQINFVVQFGLTVGSGINIISTKNNQVTNNSSSLASVANCSGTNIDFMT
jgi:hypothetical protein